MFSNYVDSSRLMIFLEILEKFEEVEEFNIGIVLHSELLDIKRETVDLVPLIVLLIIFPFTYDKYGNFRLIMDFSRFCFDDFWTHSR